MTKLDLLLKRLKNKNQEYLFAYCASDLKNFRQ
jgi:hypothetical protein